MFEAVMDTLKTNDGEVLHRPEEILNHDILVGSLRELLEGRQNNLFRQTTSKIVKLLHIGKPLNHCLNSLEGTTSLGNRIPSTRMAAVSRFFLPLYSPFSYPYPPCYIACKYREALARLESRKWLGFCLSTFM